MINVHAVVGLIACILSSLVMIAVLVLCYHLACFLFAVLCTPLGANLFLAAMVATLAAATFPKRVSP